MFCRVILGVILGICRGSIGIMENNMETTITPRGKGCRACGSHGRNPSSS